MRKLYFLLAAFAVLWACNNSKQNTLVDDDNNEDDGWTKKQYAEAMKACIKRATVDGKYDGAEDDCKCALKKLQKQRHLI